MEKYINIKTLELEEAKGTNTFTFNDDESIESIEVKLSETFIGMSEGELEQLTNVINDALSDTDEQMQKFDISHWVSNRSFGELKDMFEDGEILVPDMQRNYIWTPQQSSRLIESIVMGLPIPPLFLLETGRNKYEVIDGLQRLTTITNFMLGKSWKGDVSRPAKLSGNILVDLKGKSYDQLEKEDKIKIKRSTIPLIEFKQFSPDNKNAKFLIFERINTGSQKLTAMQVRKALNYGVFMQELYDLRAENKIIIDCLTKKEIKDDGFEELILRSIAVSELYKNNIDYQKSLKEMLNSFVMQNGALPLKTFHVSEKLENIKALLEINTGIITSLNSKGQNTNRVNKSIFDALFSAIPSEKMSESDLEVFSENVEAVIKSQFFIDGDVEKGENVDNIFKFGTNNKNVIFSRIDLIKRVLDDK